MNGLRDNIYGLWKAFMWCFWNEIGIYMIGLVENERSK